MIITALLPVDMFAPEYSMWKHMPTATIPVFVMTMKSYLPDLYNSICNVTKLKGQACQTALQAVTAQVFGTFGARVHSAFIYAVMLFIWASHDSHQTDLIYSVLMEYMATADADQHRILTSAHSAYTSGVSAVVMKTQFTFSSMANTPGYVRLNYLTSLQSFTDNWQYLWQCACAVLTQGAAATTPSSALQHISQSHFKKQQPQESMQQFFSRLQAAYRQSMTQLHHIGRPELLPHPNALLSLVYDKAHLPYTQKVKTLLKSTEDYDEAQLTFDIVRDLYLKAAKLVDREFAELDAAIETHKKKPKQDKQESDKSTKASQPQQKQAIDKSKEREYLDDSSYPPNTTLHITQEQRLQWRHDPKRCENCGENHKISRCYYKRWDGQHWWATHKPMQPPSQQHSVPSATGSSTTGVVAPTQVVPHSELPTVGNSTQQRPDDPADASAPPDVEAALDQPLPNAASDAHACYATTQAFNRIAKAHGMKPIPVHTAPEPVHESLSGHWIAACIISVCVVCLLEMSLLWAAPAMCCLTIAMHLLMLPMRVLTATACKWIYKHIGAGSLGYGTGPSFG